MRRIFFLIFALTLTGAQCISFGAGGGARAGAGGVFKSLNRGDAWLQKVAIPSISGQPRNFGGVNITALAQDPQDHLAIYASTKDNGFFYSLDGGETWQEPPADLRKGFVAATVVDHKAKCTVYVATANRILKTIDCLRTFQEVYRDADPGAFITALAIDQFSPQILYAGTVKGAVVKSMDGGRSWALLRNFNARISGLVINPRNPAMVWVGLQGRGLQRSEDGGITWLDLAVPLQTYPDGKDVRKLILDPATPNGLLLAMRTKILRSTDTGASFEILPIISPETVEISALAVNPTSSRELYYGTATTFYRSLDGGKTWSTKKIPSNRAITAILVDQAASATVFVGVTEIKK